MQTALPAKFKDSLSEEERHKQSIKMLEKNPDKVPIICERHSKSKLSPLDKNKYTATILDI